LCTCLPFDVQTCEEQAANKGLSKHQTSVISLAGSIFAYYLKFENWAFWEEYSTLQLFVK
jgi:hypothetical protein